MKVKEHGILFLSISRHVQSLQFHQFHQFHPSRSIPWPQLSTRNMQSLRQYRRLERRLRQQYVNEDNTNNGSITLCTTQQEAGSSTPFEGQPLEKENQDLEKANDTTRPPSITDGADAATCSPSRSSSIAPAGPISSTGVPLDRTTTLADRFGGVHVRDTSTPGNLESRVYVVGLGNNDGDLNPRTWSLSLRIWMT